MNDAIVTALEVAAVVLAAVALAVLAWTLVGGPLGVAAGCGACAAVFGAASLLADRGER